MARPPADSLLPDLSGALGMQVLQSLHTDFTALQSGDTFGGCASGCQGGDRGNASIHRSTPDRLLIEPGLESGRRVDNQLNAFALDQVNHVRTSLFDLINALHRR